MHFSPSISTEKEKNGKKLIPVFQLFSFFWYSTSLPPYAHKCNLIHFIAMGRSTYPRWGRIWLREFLSNECYYYFMYFYVVMVNSMDFLSLIAVAPIFDHNTNTHSMNILKYYVKIYALGLFGLVNVQMEKQNHRIG